MFKNRLPLLLSFLLLITLPFGVYANDFIVPLGTGGAANIWTVYAFGNGQAIYDTLKAVTHFVQTDMFRSAASLVAVSGALVLALKSGATVEVGRKFIGYAFLVMLFTYVFFGWGSQGKLAINLVIYEVDTGYQFAPLTVPAAVGIPAAVISTAGREMTAAIESSFSGTGSGASGLGTPAGLKEALKMSNGAPFNLAASLAQDSVKARIVDPYFNNSLAYYTQDCLAIGVVGGFINAGEMASSTNFLLTIGGTGATGGTDPTAAIRGGDWGAALSVMTFLSNTTASSSTSGGSVNAVTPVPMGEITSCKNAWERITYYVRSKDIAGLLTSTSAWSTTPTSAMVTAGYDAFYSQIDGTTGAGSSATGASQSQTKIRQAAMINAYSGVQSTVAAATGNSELLTALTLEQAKQNQYNSWVTGAEVFNRMMGYILALLQVFVYAALPMMLVLALIPGLGGKLFVNFSQILLWLAIVQPLLAIVNFIILSMQSSELGGMYGGSGGGVSLASIGIASEKTANLRAAGSFIGTMVPAIAWGLVKGGMDFSKVIAAGVGEQFASTAATTMTTGNYSLNSASIDTFSANKRSISGNSNMGNGFSVNDMAAEGGWAGGGIPDPKQMMGGSMAQLGSNVGNTKNIQNTSSGSTASQEQVNFSKSLANAMSGTNSLTASQAQQVASSVMTGAKLDRMAGDKDKGSSPVGYPGAGAPGAAPGAAPGGAPGAAADYDFDKIKASITSDSKLPQSKEMKEANKALAETKTLYENPKASASEKAKSAEILESKLAAVTLAGSNGPPAALPKNPTKQQKADRAKANADYLSNKEGFLKSTGRALANALSASANGTSSETDALNKAGAISGNSSVTNNGTISGGVTGSSSLGKTGAEGESSTDTIGLTLAAYTQGGSAAAAAARADMGRVLNGGVNTKAWKNRPAESPPIVADPQKIIQNKQTDIGNEVGNRSNEAKQAMINTAKSTDAGLNKEAMKAMEGINQAYADVLTTKKASNPANYLKATAHAMGMAADGVAKLAAAGGAAALTAMGLDSTTMRAYAQALDLGKFDKATDIITGTKEARSNAIASLKDGKQYTDDQAAKIIAEKGNKGNIPQKALDDAAKSKTSTLDIFGKNVKDFTKSAGEFTGTRAQDLVTGSTVTVNPTDPPAVNTTTTSPPAANPTNPPAANPTNPPAGKPKKVKRQKVNTTNPPAGKLPNR